MSDCNSWVIRHTPTNEIFDFGPYETEDEALDVLARLPIWDDEYDVICEDEPPTDEGDTQPMPALFEDDESTP